MMIGEIKKWAKSLDYEVKNSKEGGYSWKHTSNKEYSHSEDVETLAKDIFNHLTKDKWKDYQEKFQKLA
jgi:hypothetical protein